MKFDIETAKDAVKNVASKAFEFVCKMNEFYDEKIPDNLHFFAALVLGAAPFMLFSGATPYVCLGALIVLRLCYATKSKN